MARPSNSPRLAQIDPTKLASEIASQALDHLASLHSQLCGVLEGSLQLPAPEHTEIYRTVRVLAGYARGDHGLDAPVQEYLISLVPLYLAVLGQAGEPDGAELSTELGVVIHAAQGRDELARARGSLTTLQLAALGGMAQNAVALLCRQGELTANQGDGEWRVTAATARRWLSARAARLQPSLRAHEHAEHQDGEQRPGRGSQ